MVGAGQCWRGGFIWVAFRRVWIVMRLPSYIFLRTDLHSAEKLGRIHREIKGVTQWGSFLRRGVHFFHDSFFYESVAYGKRWLWALVIRFIFWLPSQMLCRRSRTLLFLFIYLDDVLILFVWWYTNHRVKPWNPYYGMGLLTINDCFSIWWTNTYPLLIPLLQRYYNLKKYESNLSPKNQWITILFYTSNST